MNPSHLAFVFVAGMRKRQQLASLLLIRSTATQPPVSRARVAGRHQASMCFCTLSATNCLKARFNTCGCGDAVKEPHTFILVLVCLFQVKEINEQRDGEGSVQLRDFVESRFEIEINSAHATQTCISGTHLDTKDSCFPWDHVAPNRFIESERPRELNSWACSSL